MATISTVLRCDLQEAVKPTYLEGSFFVGDNQGNQITVAVFSDGEPASVSGTVSALVLKDDGTTITVSGGSISGNNVSIALPSNALDIPGKVSVAIKLTTGSVVTTLALLVAYIYG